MVQWDKIEKEFKYYTSRSSGAGGQHVNKVETRVTACLDITNSIALTEEEKELVLVNLKNKVDKKHKLCVSSQNSRTQLKNKNTAREKLIALLQKALIPKKIRKKTKIPFSKIEKRLHQKKSRSELKSSRKRIEY